jgi:hypothetical protein
MASSINHTSLKFKRSTIQKMIDSYDHKIYLHDQQFIKPNEALIKERLSLKETLTMLKNIEQLGTHDPAIIRKQANQTFEQLLFQD